MRDNWIEDKDKLPDIVSICFKNDMSQKCLFKMLWELDRMVTGYTDEMYDEWGDNPEEYDVPPSIQGYNLQYTPDLRYTSLDIFLFRDKDIENDWLQMVRMLSSFKVKVDHINARSQRTGPSGFKGSCWGDVLKGKLPNFIDLTEERAIYGLDLEKYEDRQLFYKWVFYMMKNYNNPEDKKNTDYYEWTGTLGHDDHN